LILFREVPGRISGEPMPGQLVKVTLQRAGIGKKQRYPAAHVLGNVIKRGSFQKEYFRIINRERRDEPAPRRRDFRPGASRYQSNFFESLFHHISG
jgi:hypothetical protein